MFTSDDLDYVIDFSQLVDKFLFAGYELEHAVEHAKKSVDEYYNDKSNSEV